MSSEWEISELGKEAINASRTFSFKQYPQVVFVNTGDVHGGKFLHATVSESKGLPGQAKKALRKNDILLTEIRPGNGRYAYVDIDVSNYVVSTKFMIIESLGRVSPRFLYHVLTNQAALDEFQKIAESRSGTFPQITFDSIAHFPVPIPSKSEQESLVEFLDALGSRISILREINATLEAVAQALFKSWFVDFDPVHAKMEGRTPEGMDEATAALFPDALDETELGWVPKGWHWGALSDFSTFQNGYAFKSKDWTENGHPVVKIGDVKPGIIDLVGCSYVAQQTVVGLERFKLRRGDLLVGMTGYVGETGLVPSVEPAAYLNQRVGRIATKSGLADLGYVYCVARSPAFKEFAEAQSHGSAQANVSGASLIAFPAVIAPASLMERFNSVIAGLLEGALANYEQAQTLAALRDSLLPRLISGQLRLPEAQAELEAADVV